MPSEYEVVKAWRAKNKEKVAAQARRYRARHPDKVKAIKHRYRNSIGRGERLVREAELRRVARKSDPEGRKRRSLEFRRRQELKLAMIAGRARPNICELCNDASQEKVVFDHCHSSGLFRGWLCDRCNRTLGQVKDNPELLRKMAEYLERGGFGYGPVVVQRAEVITIQ